MSTPGTNYEHSAEHSTEERVRPTGPGGDFAMRAARYPLKLAKHALWRSVVANEAVSRLVLPSVSRLTTTLVPNFRPGHLRHRDGHWWLEVDGERTYALPDVSSNATNLKHGTVVRILTVGFGNDRMVRRYELPGFIELEADDVVVDVGGYVGTFAAYADTLVDTVYSLEPEPLTFSCLSHNVADRDDVHSHEVGLWSSAGTMSIATEADRSDTHLTEDGNVEVEVTTLERFTADQDIDEVDFLKLDAEGFEHHVLDGMGDLTVHKIGVDCGEGDADNTGEIQSLLEARGYEVRTDGHLLYARL
ncbi:FkbM family methyltransferase [Haloarchaeobius salinus]|uniref:FkbM family methyltransferase n=1 Tax=Haloarchaeobius salinus TaxID=1198298 RepID=UPI00210E7E40|nr:FkbM family methyltransferase [Haloarchaeobius salinus]